jgi:hypothetical protein
MNHIIAHVRPDACDQVLVPQTQHHVWLYKMVSALSNQARTFAVANKASRRAVRPAFTSQGRCPGHLHPGASEQDKLKHHLSSGPTEGQDANPVNKDVKWGVVKSGLSSAWLFRAQPPGTTLVCDMTVPYN